MSEDANPANPKPPSVDRLSKRWRRINDHKIAQWSVAYVALAYGIQHGVELTRDAFEWPHAVVRVSMLLLVLGLPLVMTLAWYHGERASRRISGPELTIISLLLVGISLLFYVFARPSEEVAVGPRPAVQQAGVAAARSASLNPGNAISIAVLPFANVSGDPGQEFFSDGMTDEIMTALAKLSALRVVGRESAFQFKGQKPDMRALGRSLSATYLIEGSVRKAGDRVRITAQLVQADDGVSVWAESYDRQLTDIFATQEDIAQTIAAALRVPLGLQKGQALISSRTTNEATYEDYLRAKALVRARGPEITQAINILEAVVARDPSFAPAWAQLALAYEQTPIYTPAIYTPAARSGNVEGARRAIQAAYDKADKAAREAIRLNSRLALGYDVLARMENNGAAAEDLFRQALALDPDEPDVLVGLSFRLARAGRLKESLSLREKLRTLEPFVPDINLSTAALMQTAGQNAASIPILEVLPADTVGGRELLFAQAYAAAGRYADAADMLLRGGVDPERRQLLENAARLLRAAPAKATEPLPNLEYANFVYAYVGAPEHMMDYPERQRKIGAPSTTFVIYSLWSPLSAPVRKTERFKSYVRDAGFLDYWRAKGWPDLCRPMGVDDFVCD